MINEFLTGILLILLVILAVFFLPIMVFEMTIDRASNLRELSERAEEIEEKTHQ